MILTICVTRPGYRIFSLHSYGMKDITCLNNPLRCQLSNFLVWVNISPTSKVDPEEDTREIDIFLWSYRGSSGHEHIEVFDRQPCPMIPLEKMRLT